jgi:site-specific DNA-methyltransferase (adenine-specific)
MNKEEIHDKVKKYSALSNICPEAWSVVVTTFEENDNIQKNKDGTIKVPVGTFTEGLLRDVLDLLPYQQVELIKNLADGKIKKKDFKVKAQSYTIENEIMEWIKKALFFINDEKEYSKELEKLSKEVYNGTFDKEWINNDNQPGKRLELRIESVKEKYGGDFRNMHCIDYINTLEDNSVDLFLIDPPYGMDFDSGWSKKEKIENDGIKDTVKLLEETFRNVIPKLKEDALIYVFGNNKFICEIQPLFQKYFNMKNLLIWDREIIGMGDLESYGASYDIIYFGYNKKFRGINGERPRDILKFRRTDPGKLDHPTVKPLDLIKFIIEKSTIQGENVLDCFAGSGTTLIASKELKRGFFGCEINEEYFNIALKKLNEV